MSKSQFILIKYMFIPSMIKYGEYHDYLLVATAECFVFNLTRCIY